MEKRILIFGVILIIIVAVIFFFAKWQKQHEWKKTYEGNSCKVYLFWEGLCSHCREIKPFLLELRKKYGFTLIEIDVLTKEGEKTYWKFCEKYAKKLKEIGVLRTPLVFIGEKPFLGFEKDVDSFYYDNLKVWLGTPKSIEEEIKKCVGGEND